MISMAGRQRRCPPHPLVLLGLLLLTRCSTAQPPMSPGSALGSSAPDSPCHTAPQLCSRLRTSISLQLAAHRDAAASGLLDIADNGDGGVTDHDLTDGGAGGGAAAGQDGQSPSPSPSSSLQASLLEGLGELVAARTATAPSPSPTPSPLPKRSPSPAPRRSPPPRPPAAIRILPEFQLGSLADYGFSNQQQVETDIKAVVWAAIRVIQDHVKVKHPVGSTGLLIRPTYLNQTQCDAINSRSATQGWTCDGPGWNPTWGPGLSPTDYKNPWCGMGDIDASHMLNASCFDETTGQWRPNCIRNAAGGSGGQKADMYLYVTNDQSLCGGGTLAYSLPCLYDWKSNRPQAANLNICTDGLSGSLSRVLAIAVHELVHTLGFASDAYQLYVDDKNRELGVDRVVQNITYPAASPNRTGRIIITPKVVQQVRLQFGCPSLEGALLEDQGDATSAGSHWEQEVFQGDSMVPSASVWDGSLTRLSRVTLALLEDSGWYVTNLATAPFLDWGRNGGCALPQKKCSVVGAPYFCDQSLPTALFDLNCSFDGRSRGLCVGNQFTACGMWMVRSADRDMSVTASACNSQLYYQVSGQPQLDKQGESAFGWSIGRDSRCGQVLLPFTSTSAPTVFLGSGGFSSYCWPTRCSIHNNSTSTNATNTTATTNTTNMTNKTATTNSSVTSSATAQPTVQYSIRGRWLDCPVGETLQMRDYFGTNLTGRLVCPTTQLQAAAYCRGLECPSGCGTGLSQGVCFEGKCVCMLGYGGPSCSLSYLYMSILALNETTATPIL